MKMTFKLYASLICYLPAGASGQVVELEVPEETTTLGLLQQYGVPISQVHLVLINGVFVPPDERSQPLNEGDELAVWPAVAGG